MLENEEHTRGGEQEVNTTRRGFLKARDREQERPSPPVRSAGSSAGKRPLNPRTRVALSG